MDDNLRVPLLLLAIFLIIMIVGLEVGSTVLTPSLPKQVTDMVNKSDIPPGLNPASFGNKSHPPGLGIPYMALVDAVVLFTAALIGSSLVVPRSAEAKIQGCATGIFSVLLILASIGLIFVAIGLLLLMITLLISVPFGTIAYLVIYGSFNRPVASEILGLVMMLKIGFGVCLVLANPRFLQNKGLVFILLTSLLANVIVSLLQGLVPIILVSITDAIAAIVVAILAVIWCIFLLIGSIGSIMKVLKPS